MSDPRQVDSDAVRVSPMTPDRLAHRALQRAAEQLDQARLKGVVVRLGVDGAVEQETRSLADLIAGKAIAAGVGVLRVRAADFLHRRSVRLEWGPDDVDAAFQRSVDWASLQREVLDPLADPSSLRWLPRLRDAGSDRGVREPALQAAPGALLVVDGPYLLRRELSGAIDVAVHLVTSPSALHRRFPGSDDPRPGAWQRYLDECDPAARADLVVRYDHPQRPALME